MNSRLTKLRMLSAFFGAMGLPIGVLTSSFVLWAVGLVLFVGSILTSRDASSSQIARSAKRLPFSTLVTAIGLALLWAIAGYVTTMAYGTGLWPAVPMAFIGGLAVATTLAVGAMSGAFGMSDETVHSAKQGGN